MTANAFFNISAKYRIAVNSVINSPGGRGLAGEGREAALTQQHRDALLSQDPVLPTRSFPCLCRTCRGLSEHHTPLQPKIFSSSRNQHPNSLQGSVRALSSYRAVPKALQAAAKNKLRQHTLRMNPGGAKSPSRAAAAPF